MESYTLIWVRDARSRPMQFSFSKQRAKQAVIAAAVVGLIGLVAVWDYWRLRADNAELAGLRIEAFEQREQIALFRDRLAQVDGQLERVAELERKVRIIANLPGAAGIGGEDLVEVVPDSDGVVAPPIGVPVDRSALRISKCESSRPACSSMIPVSAAMTPATMGAAAEVPPKSLS